MKSDRGKRVKRITLDWLKITVLLLDEAAVIAAILLILHYAGVRIPIAVLAVVAVVIAVVVFLLHLAIIPVFHKKPITGIEGMMGLQEGRVVEPLTPVGSIKLRGEYWKAESVDGDISVDENVEIVGSEGLTLKVKRKE